NKLFGVDGYISSSAEAYLNERLPFATSLWDGNPDEAMSIMFTGVNNKTNITIDLERHKGIYDIENLKRILTSIAEKYTLNYFSIFFSNNEKVFPERPNAGWMIYLPVNNLIITINKCEKIERINIGDNKGRLFIVKNIYNCFDETHRHASNDLEIELVDAGFLPLYKDI
ncbi:immunity 52 family protein, partial [Salmonella enterica subsp. enterica]|nr:immunity 52 family protein [Salmonella enterica subsp. enterica]